MLYGMQDIARTMIGILSKTDELRSGEFWAVDSLSFELRRGECLGLIGPNGSGKSTLLKILNGIISPDKGRVEIRGRVGALIEIGAGFHPMLTGRENIYINGSILGFSKKEIDNKFDEIVDFAELADFIDTPVKHYSSGMYVRLGFAIAAQMEPDIFLIDEVLAVGDVGFRAKCFNVIDKISKKAAVIFVSHAMPQVARICSDVIVMKGGRSVYQGNHVEEGVSYYYEQFEGAKASITGSGRASIHAVKLYSDDTEETGDKLFKIEYLNSLYIEVTFLIDPDISSANMNIAFMDRDIRAAAQCYSINCNFEILNKGKPTTTRVKLPNLQLNPGIYTISIVLTDIRRGETLTNCHMIKEFQVLGSFIGFAPVQFQGEWKYV
jgi:lipopolysaccharide transport system ATP-binding protein